MQYMKRNKNTTLKSIKKRADNVFSKWIRNRDCPGSCCTCGTPVRFETSDAGHFIARNHESTRYDEKNVHAQCRKCNRFESGKQFEHALFIDKKYGQGTAEQLLIKSKMICKRTIYDYEHIIEKYANN